MRKLLACLLFVASSAYADGLLRVPGGDMIGFKESEPCTHEKVLPHIKPEYRAMFRAAGALIGGKTYNACWAEHPQDPRVVYVVYEDGDISAIPRSAIVFDPKV